MAQMLLEIREVFRDTRSDVISGSLPSEGLAHGKADGILVGAQLEATLAPVLKHVYGCGLHDSHHFPEL